MHTLYGLNYTHTVNEKKEEWDQYEIIVSHKRELECSRKELVPQFRNLWPVFNKIWLKYHDHKKTRHMQFVGHVLSQCSITHPHLCDLVRILLAVAPSTRPLERSYSKLAKLCLKDQNQLSSKNIKVLYILAALTNPEIDYNESI